MGKRRCCIDGCPGVSDRYSLFLPPKKDTKTYKKWLRAVNRYKKTFTRCLFVCELHFKPNEILRHYITTLKDGTVHKLPRDRKSLVAGAYPTIFSNNTDLASSSKRIKKFSDKRNPRDSSPKIVAYVFSSEDGKEEVHSEYECMEAIRESKILRERHSSQSDVSDEGALENVGDNFAKIVWTQDDSSDVILDEDSIAYQTKDTSATYSSENDETFDKDVYDPTYHTESCVSDDENMVQSADVYFGLPAKTDSHLSQDVQFDLCSILKDGSSPEKMNNDTFIRFCQNHIKSNVIKKGRSSFLDKIPSRGSSNELSDGLQVVHKVVTRKLEVESLLNRMDSMTYPSKNWFHTTKDGAPTFLCWNEGFRIEKTVVFNPKNLDPTILLNDQKILIPEVVRPRSIHDVQSILRLVDSVRECPGKKNQSPCACQGFYISVKHHRATHHLCSQCLLLAERENKLTEEELTFDMVCRWAKEIVKDLTTWSYTLLGTAVVLIGWMKCYTIERLLIINNDLSIKVLIGGKFISTDLAFRNRLDFSSAIAFLEKCRKCFGIGESRYASDCLGFVVDKDNRLRVPKCQPCIDAKRRELCRSKQPKPAKFQHVRRPGSDFEQMTISDSTDPIGVSLVDSEENAENGAAGKSVHLVDVLDCVSLPTDSWSCTVVDGSVVFAHWDLVYRIDKRVIVLPNTMLLIYAEDDLVKIDGAVAEVKSIFDVEQALILAECLQFCSGYGPSLKAEGCSGYFIPASNVKHKDKGLCHLCAAALRQQKERTIHAKGP